MSQSSRKLWSSSKSVHAVETWNTKWADFSLITETGEEFKCHKVVLAKESKFFEAMLLSDCKETKTNKMKVKDFSLETVTTFLEYIYAGLKWNSYFYTKQFDKAKITLELMRFCHTYKVEGLSGECSNQLGKNIDEDNVVSIWMEAEKFEATNLKDYALQYIAKLGQDIASLPGIEEAYRHPKLMKGLVDYMARRLQASRRCYDGCCY